MPEFHIGGRHELGQNFLIDHGTIAAIVAVVEQARGPIIEIGAGSGALTHPLGRLGRELTAIELDPRRAAALRARLGTSARVVTGDALRFAFPEHPHVIVGNLPFHLTTAILRRILTHAHWTDAVLLVQWEVARRRAGVGGATLLTVTSWPWYDFTLLRRVPARAFRPMPSVDGGLLHIRRRERPLLPNHDRERFDRFAHRVFTGRGRGVLGVLRAERLIPPAALDRWARTSRIDARTLPKDLDAQQWIALWSLVR